ncbi:hypothetical protein SNE40_013832 [Patella caerulea]|uniref:Uncharacterized protein n=1 Tax=Patella caerulea TaxID=87958 RepID=A0AAN8PBM4_PATCE
MEIDTDLDGTVEDVSPPGSPKYKPPDAIVKPKIHTGSYSIQRLMEKDPVTPMEVPDQHLKTDQQQPRDQPQQIMMPNLLPVTNMPIRSARPNRRFPNPSPFTHQPIRHLHHMASLLPHTPERSLTSSLSQVLMSQMDHHITPDMHARSIRHLESLQCRPFENGSMRNGNGYVNQDMNCYETGNPLWDLYYTYRDEIVPVREYYDAVPGVTRNVIKVEEEKTLLVL